ncbi:hypothetical protein T484DRAFT_1893238, partial [Baffinella frigidus]
MPGGRVAMPGGGASAGTPPESANSTQPIWWRTFSSSINLRLHRPSSTWSRNSNRNDNGRLLSIDPHDHLEGFLEKKRGGLHLWKRRYFIYRDGNLSYFVDQAAAEANAGRRAVSVSSVVMERGMSGMAHSHRLAITSHDDSTLTLSFATEQQQLAWHRALTGTATQPCSPSPNSPAVDHWHASPTKMDAAMARERHWTGEGEKRERGAERDRLPGTERERQPG